MPKKKTKKMVAKRVKRTATGKLVYSRPGHSHLMSSKSSKRRRHLRRSQTAHSADLKRLSIMI